MSSSECLKVTPTSGTLHRIDIPAALESLHKLSNPAAESLWNRVNPGVDTSPPTFEFLAVSAGPDAPVEFYYGANQEEHLNTLEKRLRSIYPTTFTVMRTELDLEAVLIPESDLAANDLGSEEQGALNQEDLRTDSGESDLEGFDEGEIEDETPKPIRL